MIPHNYFYAVENPSVNFSSYFVPHYQLSQGLAPSTEADTQLMEKEKEEKILEMQERLRELQKQISELRQENGNLQSRLRPKRHYSKRRMNLEKRFICPNLSCPKAYSSKIALQSHLKKKHNKKEHWSTIRLYYKVPYFSIILTSFANCDLPILMISDQFLHTTKRLFDSNRWKMI